jgi:hypothetical protein
MPNPTALSRLFRLGATVSAPVAAWNDADRAAMLRHHLSLPLDEPAVEADDGWSGRSHRDLFTQPDTPLPRLRQAKDRAKRGVTDGDDGPLPRDVATVLYYAALAAAHAFHHTAITRLDPMQVRTGLRWTLELPWLDGDLRRLFERALDANPGAEDA